MNSYEMMINRLRPLVTFAAMAAVFALALFAGGSDSVHAARFEPALNVTITDPAPGKASDVVANFDLQEGDVNFAAVVSYIPREWGIVRGADIPIGMQTGQLTAQSVLGILNASCNQQIEVKFDMLNSSINTADLVSFDDTEDAETGDLGLTQDFADDIEYVTKEGDTIQSVSELLKIPEADLIRINGINPDQPLQVRKAIGNGIQDGIERYPDFLTRVFVDKDDKILQPIRRSGGITNVAGAAVFLQFLIFPPGTVLPTRGSATLPSDPDLGYPSVTVLQNIGDPEIVPEPGIIHDFCTPLATVNTTYGSERDEAGNVKPGGMQFFVNPGGEATYKWTTFAFGQRDADGDTYENSFDTCPLLPNVGNPRVISDGDADNDGLDEACDPNSDFATGTNSDQDGDGYQNRNDNCTLIANGEEETNQKDTDLDQIGDACDNNPDTPDGDLSQAEPTKEVAIGSGSGSPAPPTAAQCPNCYVENEPIKTNPPHGDNTSGSGSSPTAPGSSGGPTATGSTGAKDDDGGSSGTTIAIIIGAIAAVVILGGGAVLAMRRKSSS